MQLRHSSCRVRFEPIRTDYVPFQTSSSRERGLLFHLQCPVAISGHWIPCNRWESWALAPTSVKDTVARIKDRECSAMLLSNPHPPNFSQPMTTRGIRHLTPRQTLHSCPHRPNGHLIQSTKTIFPCMTLSPPWRFFRAAQPPIAALNRPFQSHSLPLIWIHQLQQQLERF